jgi:uncharacterized membrane protein YphA (DoxX/SURF4 family)
MLNPFPIQFLTLAAHLILRIITGYILVRLGYRHICYRVELRHMFPFGVYGVILFAVLEVIIGILFIIGLYTQIAAIAAVLLSLYCIAKHGRLTHPRMPRRTFYGLLCAISLSLFITGAGALAFDLPL